METEIILLDTSILIDFYRKKDKNKSKFSRLSDQNIIFAISVITHFEIFAGVRLSQTDYWNNLFHDFAILPLNKDISLLATQIDVELKKKRKQIDIPDLFIAATALVNKLPLATINKKHFERIENLKLIDIS